MEKEKAAAGRLQPFSTSQTGDQQVVCEDNYRYTLDRGGEALGGQVGVPTGE